MSGGSISGCTEGYYGGGVYNAGTFTMSSGSIFGNGEDGVNGGGVYNASNSSMTMSGGMISLNVGVGGVYSDKATVSVTGGAVFGNVWESVFALKTAHVDFFCWKDDKDQNTIPAANQMQTSDCSFENAKWRVHYDTGSSNSADVTDSLPSKQVDATQGKWFYLAYEAVDYTGTQTTQASGIFLNGSTGDDALAGTGVDTAVRTFAKAKALAEAALAKGETNVTIYVCGQVTVSGAETWSLPENVTLKRLDGYDGYLVSVPSKATLTLTNITIDGNRPTLDGVNVNIKCTDSLLSVNGTLNLQDGAVLQNNLMGQKKTYGGGAIYCNGGAVNMTGGVMRNNETDGHGGAMVVVGSTARFDMSGGIIQNNRADFGGAVAILRGAQMTLKGNASVAGNTAKNAGGIAVGGRRTDSIEPVYGTSTLTMSGGSISGNLASAGSGGGLYVQVNCKATISEGSITRNHATGYNGRPWAGGGIYVNEQTTYSLTGSSQSLPDGVLQLYNVEIANNSANSGGGLAACPTSNVKIVLKDGGVFHDNKSRTAADEIYVYESKSSATAYISDFMLGGGMYQWMHLDGTRAEQSYYQNTKDFVYLNNICAAEDVKKAHSLAKVFITGNTADYNGGGIAANGTVLIGDTADTENASITIEKHWNAGSESNAGAEAENRPESVKVDIQYGGYTLRGIVLSKQNNWTVTLQNVPSAVLAQNNPTVKVMEFDSGWYTVKNVTATVKDNALTISFTNAYTPLGDLTVQKTVSGVGADPHRAFDFSVMLSDRTVNGVYGDMTFTNGVAKFQLKHGQSATATGLPAGVTYTVNERTGSGYTASILINGQKVLEAVGSISTDAADVVAFENVSNFHIPKTGDNTPLTLCLLLMLLSLSGAGFLWRKKY